MRVGGGAPARATCRLAGARPNGPSNRLLAFRHGFGGACVIRRAAQLRPPLVSVVAASDETGGGTTLAAIGRHFSALTSQGVAVIKSEPIAGMAENVTSVAACEWRLAFHGRHRRGSHARRGRIGRGWQARAAARNGP